MEDSHPPRRLSVHEALGGGSVADVLLWRRWFKGSMVLVLATMIWVLFERLDYNPLTFMANALLFFVGILFLWAKSANLLNRPLPPLPNLEISEKSISKAANMLLPGINYALLIAEDIAVNHNVTLLFEVTFGFSAIFFLGSLCSFLTFSYIVIILALSVPFFYDKYRDLIDDKLHVTQRFVRTMHRKFKDIILKKIPLPSSKEKKIR